MKFWGYPVNEERDTPLELSEVTFVVNTEDLQSIIDFLERSKKLLILHGDDFEHEHMLNFSKERKSGPDLIVFNESKTH